MHTDILRVTVELQQALAMKELRLLVQLTARGQAIGPGFAHDGLRGCQSIRHGFHHGRGAPTGVAQHEDLPVPEDGPPLFVEGRAIGKEQVRIHLFAQGGDHGGAGEGDLFAGVHRGPTAGGIRFAKDHSMAQQILAVGFYRGQEFFELHAFPQGQQHLLFVGRHILFGPPVDDGHVLYAGHPQGRPSAVHGRVARADDDDVFAQIHRLPGLQLLQKLDGVVLLAADIQPGGLFGAHGQQDIVEVLFQFRQGRGRLPQYKGGAQGGD